MPTLRFAAILSLFLVQSLAQQPETVTPNPVFRANSTLVQIDAVVTDAKGNQVPNLTADDFELYADGVLQPITRFSYIAVSPSSAPHPKNVAENPLLAPPPTASLHRGEVRRTMVLMVDDLNLSFESMAFVRSSLLKFIDEQMQPGDLVAVCRTGSGSSAFQQFTSDRRLARSVVNSLRWNPRGIYGVSFFDSATPGAHPNGVIAQGEPVTLNTSTQQMLPMSQQLDRLRQNTLAAGALGGIDYIVQALRDMPGRKSVILFSDGLWLNSGDDFTMAALHRLVDRANRSGTVIYTMHAAGLLTLQRDAADNPELTQNNRGVALSDEDNWFADSNSPADRGDRLFRAQSGLEYLAKLTGGSAYFNGNSLNYGLSRFLEDQKGYYLLGYSPPSDTFDAKKGERPYHNLKLVVKDKQLRVRSRTGFYGATDEETKPHFANPIEELRAIMLSPFTASGIALRLTPIYSEVPGHGPVVRNLLSIDAHDLTFKRVLDGSYESLIKLMGAAYGPDNKQITGFAFNYTVTVAPGKMDEVLRDGALYDVTIPLPQAGGFHMRVAVRDEATQKTGSANAFIEIPDARKKQLALTSVVLASAASDSNTLATSAAKRQFHHGDILQYFSLLENGDPKHIAASDTSAQIRVVNNGKQIYLGPARLVDLPGNRRAVNGSLKLGDKLPTGDYFLQIVASLPASRKKAPTDQWTDFELLP